MHLLRVVHHRCQGRAHRLLFVPEHRTQPPLTPPPSDATHWWSPARLLHIWSLNKRLSDAVVQHQVYGHYDGALLCRHVPSHPGSVSEFNRRRFLRGRCSMEMWCPDDIGWDSWDWVGKLSLPSVPPTRPQGPLQLRPRHLVQPFGVLCVVCCVLCVLGSWFFVPVSWFLMLGGCVAAQAHRRKRKRSLSRWIIVVVLVVVVVSDTNSRSLDVYVSKRLRINYATCAGPTRHPGHVSDTSAPKNLQHQAP